MGGNGERKRGKGEARSARRRADPEVERVEGGGCVKRRAGREKKAEGGGRVEGGGGKGRGGNGKGGKGGGEG